MKTLHFDSVGGASGDMILGALLGLDNKLDELNALFSEIFTKNNSRIAVENVKINGLTGLRAKVILETAVDEKHHHRGLPEIQDLIEKSNLPSDSKILSMKVFRCLAEAEAKIHGVNIEEIHFHEVGALDSIIDIVGSCWLLNQMGVDRVTCSPLALGQGVVKCQHGLIPIPAPATLELLKNVPVIQTQEPFEMVTPTGAALLTTWMTEFAEKTFETQAPLQTAYSFGHRELNERPNLLRATIFETANSAIESDIVSVLETNLDDCSPEIIGHVFERLLSDGALDVFTSHIQMKKQRPGVLLSVICDRHDKDRLTEIIFRETGTFGVREKVCERSKLKRRIRKVQTEFGELSVKMGSLNGEDIVIAPEADDCRRLASKHGVSFKEIYQAAISHL